MSRSVAIVDLDRGLLSAPLGPVAADALRQAGVSAASMFAVASGLRGLIDASGPLSGELACRALALGLRGTDLGELEAAGKAAARGISERLAPYAQAVMAAHRGDGRRLVMTTSLPEAMAAPLGQELGFDAVVATRLAAGSGRATGTVDGPVVWGRGKLLAVRSWAADHGAVLRRSYAYCGSVQDAALLAEVHGPHAVDPDPGLGLIAWLKGWPTLHLDVPPGVVKVAGHEIQDLIRPFARPELTWFARFELAGLHHIPAGGPAIVCANHRSYFDAVAVGMALSRSGRNARFLGKKEVFDAPVVGAAARWIGGIRVERGSGSDEPLEAAAAALRAGEVITLMPQGTIPRGPAFFDPELKGRWGAARLAAMTRAPVIPVGLWGTEQVWPRSSRIPDVTPLRRPLVQVKAGPPVKLSYRSADADTKRIMRAIVDLLPDEARVQREPTMEELARTYPAGYRGDPTGEDERRPGFDT